MTRMTFSFRRPESDVETISDVSTPQHICLCQPTAISLFEVAIPEPYGPEPRSVSVALQSKKNALKTCLEVLDCHLCEKGSAFLLLLVQICQKFADSCVTLAQRLRSKTPIGGANIAH